MATILPAILETTASRLKQRMKAVPSKHYHIDIIDGTWIAKKTLTAQTLAKAANGHKFSVHFMAKNPEKYFKVIKRLAFLVVGHIEVVKDVEGFVKEAKKNKLRAGLAINPNTPLKKLLPYVKLLDHVLVMTVTPGKQGQTFQSKALAKVRTLRKKFPKLSIGVDGGVHKGNARRAEQAGASVLVVGSAIVWADNPKQSLKELRAEVR